MIESKRLRELRKQLGFTQVEFAEKLNIKQGSYSDIERGKVGISAHLLKYLIIEYQVNPIWLYEGRGEKFLKDGGTAKENEFENKTELLRAYQKTIQIQQEYINSLKNQLHVLKIVKYSKSEVI